MTTEQVSLIAAIAGDSDAKSQLANQVFGSLPGERLIQIYENNFVSRFTDALLVTFPKTHQMLGDTCFRSLARAFIQQVPFCEASLLNFGDRFVDFLRRQRALSGYEFCTDLAHLEWALEVAYNQADIAPEFGGCVSVRPGLQLIASDYALFDVWRYQAGNDLDIKHVPQWVLVYKENFEVMASSVDAQQGVYLRGLLEADEELQLDVLNSLDAEQLTALNQLGVVTGALL